MNIPDVDPIELESSLRMIEDPNHQELGDEYVDYLMNDALCWLR